MSNLAAQNALKFHSDYEQEVLTKFINSTDAPSTLELQLIVDKHLTEESATTAMATYESLLVELKEKQLSSKSDGVFLNWMFYKVHRKALKNYTQYVTLAETLNNGNYDCLTATSLYAQLLTDLGYKPEVIETTYHIYLRINIGDINYLFESTDPLNGFVRNENEIAARLEGYNGESEINELSGKYYHFKNQLNQSIELTKLTGLQYFNTAVLTYNNQNLIETVDLLEKAILFYHSNRITEFGLVLANSISQDPTISLADKAESLNRVADFINAENTIASR